MGLFSRKNTTDFTVPILEQIQQEEESKSARKLKAEEKAMEKEKKKKKQRADKNNVGVNVIYEDYDDEDDVEIVTARNRGDKVEGDVPEWVSESSAKKEETVTETFNFAMDDGAKDEPVLAVQETTGNDQAEEISEIREEAEAAEYAQDMEDESEDAADTETAPVQMVNAAEPAQAGPSEEGIKTEPFNFSFLQKDPPKKEEPEVREVAEEAPALSVPLAEITEEEEDLGGLELDLGEKDTFNVPVQDTFPSNAQEPVKKKGGLWHGLFGKFSFDDDEREGKEEVIPELTGSEDDGEEEAEAEEIAVIPPEPEQVLEAVEESEKLTDTYSTESADPNTSETAEPSGDDASNDLIFEASANENDWTEESGMGDALGAAEMARNEEAAAAEDATAEEIIPATESFQFAPVEEVTEEAYEEDIASEKSAIEELPKATFVFEVAEDLPKAEETVTVTEEAIEPASTESAEYAFDMEEDISEEEKPEEIVPQKEESDGYKHDFEEEVKMAEVKAEEKATEVVDDGYRPDMEVVNEAVQESHEGIAETTEDAGYSYEMESEEEELTETAEPVKVQPVTEYRSDMEDSEAAENAKAAETIPEVVIEKVSSEEVQVKAEPVTTEFAAESKKLPANAETAAESKEPVEYAQDMEDEQEVAPSFEAVMTQQKEEASESLVAEPVAVLPQEEKPNQKVVPSARPNVSFEDDEAEEEKKPKKFVSPIPIPKFQKKEKSEKETPKESDVLRRYKNKRSVVGAATAAVGLGCLLALFSVAIKTTVVASGSMEPTLMTGDVNVFNRLAYVNHEVQRGDIITFWSEELSEHMSKRIVGVAGDHIDFHDGYVFINGLLADESLYLDEDIETNCSKSFDVPDGCVFVLGDNRENSVDSRFFDNPYIPEKDIIGKYLGAVPRIW